MSDDVKEQNSTPPEELRRQIMSYSEPKNEREWWAMHRIEQLEAALRKINERLNDKDSWLAQSIDARKIAEAAMKGDNGGQDRQSD